MRDNYYDHYFWSHTARYFGRSGVEWRWLKAVAIAESGLDPEAVSRAGAVGIMQLMPATAKEMALMLGIECAPRIPHINIELGIAYAKSCWDWWKAEEGIERIRFMLGSYNAGPGHILSAQRACAAAGLPTDMWLHIAAVLPDITGRHAEETTDYVSRVESFYTQLIKRGEKHELPDR
jgi:membrane-bound lytic murein transglycosylase F